MNTTKTQHHGKTFSKDNSRHARVLKQLNAYVVKTGDDEIYGSDPEATACDWAEYTTIKPSDMRRWWSAWCFEPEAAQEFRVRGISAKLAKRSCGIKCDGIDTLAYHVSMGSMSFAQAEQQLKM